MMDVLTTLFGVNTFAAALRLATPLALAAMGGAFSERAGVINIGLEGMILTGAFAAVFGTYYTGSPFVGVLSSVIAGGLLGLLLALFALRYKASHVVAGVGINILALGTTTWLMQVIWGSRGSSPNVQGIGNVTLPILSRIPVIDRLLGVQNPLVYLMLLLIVLGYVVLFKTPLGLRIRLIGEHPEAADTLGIPLRKIQYGCVMVSGMLCGLGGAYLSLGHMNAFSRNMSAGRGYMALAATIFGQWNPIGGFFASYLFGFTDALQMRLQGLQVGIPAELIKALPYTLTLIVLAGAVIRSRPPAALGKQYEIGK